MSGPPLDDPRSSPLMEDLRPAVAGRGPDRGLLVVVGGAALLGVIAFVVLASTRDGGPDPAGIAARPAGMTAEVTAPAPPSELAMMETAGRSGGYTALPGPAFVPPPLQASPPAPANAPFASFAQPQAAPRPSTTPSTAQRLAAPVLIVDLSGGDGFALAAGAVAGEAQPPSGAAGDGAAGGGALAASPEAQAAAAAVNSDERFAERVAASVPERARATALTNPAMTVPQGALVPGVLETALNSDLPGFARAVVSRDVRGFDGSTVLIPRGSRVIGQYKSGVAQGQSRAFIIWTRLIRADGASIQLASSGTDALGRAGLDGDVDRHFFQRFGGAILLSVLNAGVASLGEQPSTQVVIGSSSQATGLAATAVSPTDISPTIKVPQGSPIRIFVARDLDFSAVQGAVR